MFCTPYRFDVQSVKKIVNLTLKDQVKWLTNIQTQLVFNFEKYKINIKIMMMNIVRNNLVSKLTTKFGFNNKMSKQHGL